MRLFDELAQQIGRLWAEVEELKRRTALVVTGQASQVNGGATLAVHGHQSSASGGTIDYSGTGTINSGGTSATVTHGCPFTPTLQQITLTLGENPTNDPGIVWVDTIGATTFKVNCRSDPGASNLDFGWRVSPT